MEYLLTDAPRLEIPHALPDNDQIEIIEHADENPGMSAHCVTQELGQKCGMVRTTLKKKGISPIKFSCCTN